MKRPPNIIATFVGSAIIEQSAIYIIFGDKPSLSLFNMRKLKHEFLSTKIQRRDLKCFMAIIVFAHHACTLLILNNLQRDDWLYCFTTNNFLVLESKSAMLLHDQECLDCLFSNFILVGPQWSGGFLTCCHQRVLVIETKVPPSIFLFSLGAYQELG